jgi:hypothetical protein
MNVNYFVYSTLLISDVNKMNICLHLRQCWVANEFDYYTLGLAALVNSIFNSDFSTSRSGYDIEMADAVHFSV